MRKLLGAAILVGLIAMALQGCGDPIGEPPEISNLTYQPNTGSVGQPLTISGSFVYWDPDADADRFEGELRGPQGSSVQIAQTQVPGSRGFTEGSVTFDLFFNSSSLPVAGWYEFDIWMIDADGNESNKLTGTIDVS